MDCGHDSWSEWNVQTIWAAPAAPDELEMTTWLRECPSCGTTEVRRVAGSELPSAEPRSEGFLLGPESPKFPGFTA